MYLYSIPETTLIIYGTSEAALTKAVSTKAESTKAAFV
jgi:hypothetical protein